MKSNLLFPKTEAATHSEDPLENLTRLLDMRLACLPGQRRHSNHMGRDLGVVRMPPPTPELTPDTADLIADLGLETLFDAMADGDRIIREVAALVLVRPMDTPGLIHQRQATIFDACRHPAQTEALYAVARAAVEEAGEYRRMHQGGIAEAIPVTVKAKAALELLSLLLEKCAAYRETVASACTVLTAPVFTDLAEQASATLTDVFFQEARRQLAIIVRLLDEGGWTLHARPGPGLKATECTLHADGADGRISTSVLPQTGRRIPFGNSGQSRGQKDVALEIPLDNLSLTRSAEALANTAWVPMLRLASALSDNLLHFFTRLRFELAFLAGACRLSKAFAHAGLPSCMPVPLSPPVSGFHFTGLVDAALGLREGRIPVGNDVDACPAHLLLVTGANQGGKSTFLRSIGLAQLLMQAGLFVPAKAYRAGIHDALFTHFAREEDAAMANGRLEEELTRMDRTLGGMTSRSLLLMNESFATTTERDGARIATELILALRESGVTLLYVTHLHECAQGLWERQLPDAHFLRAERMEDGVRTFRMRPGAPQITSHAMDLYTAVMGAS